MKTKDATLPPARLTKTDKRIIKAAAKTEGKSMSNWIVECALVRSKLVNFEKLNADYEKTKSKGEKP